MLPVIVALVLLALAVVLPVVMVRGVIQMYRDRDRTGTICSGVAGMMSEFDRVVRPSVQYVFEAKESADVHENDIGGE